MSKDIYKIINETVKRAIFESQNNYDHLWDDDTNILKEVMQYIEWSQMGEMNANFSIEASKLHDTLMAIMSLDHQDQNDRRTFAKILNYIKILHKRIGIQSIVVENGNTLRIETTLCDKDDNEEGIIYIDTLDFETSNTNPLKYGIMYRTHEGVMRGSYVYREGSYNASSGIYITDAEMTKEMKQHIYNLGLVPALEVAGSYHENFIYAIGVLPDMVSLLRKYSDTIFFDCKFSIS